MPLPESFSAINAVAVMGKLAHDLVGPYQEPLGKCVTVIEKGIRDNFTSSATPTNSNWPDRQLLGDGHPLLIESGDLLQASTGGGPGHIARVFPDSAEVGVDGGVVKHAPTHNYGDRSRNIPQREFIGVRDERLDECGEILADYVEREKF